MRSRESLSPVALLLPIGVVLSCRIGGPSADPDMYDPLDSGADATLEGGHNSQGEDAPVGPDDQDASVLNGQDSAPFDDTGTAADASTPDGAVGAGGCDAAIAVCDPVHNTGCNALLQQQCDVNTLVTTMPTGNCVYNSGGAEAGGACIASPVSESCAPRSTCVSGACRTLCFCNADCPSAQCCSDTSGPPGFTLCGPCK
jgi:hypothetical protein